MTLQQLCYIVEIEKTRSITWAADNLFMSQPNLSRSIRELEKGLGFEIFRRTSRGMVPTREGSELIARAKKIIFQMDSIDEISMRKRQKRQSFGISVPPVSYIALAFRHFMSDLDPKRPIDVDYCETDTIQAIENLREQRHHLAVVRYTSASQPKFLQLLQDYSLTMSQICEQESLILLAKQHPLADYECIDHTALSDFIELKLNISADPASSVLQDRSDSQKQVVIYSRNSQFDLLFGDSTAFMWSTPLPAEILEREGFVMRPCSLKGTKYTDALLWRSSYSLSDADQMFIKHLHKVADRFQ